MTPHLIFISIEYAPVIGGAEKQTRNLAEALARTDFTVTVLTRWHPGLKMTENINGVEVKRLKTIWMPLFSWISFTVGVLLHVFKHRREKLILQPQILSVPALAAALAAHWFRKPALVKLAAGGKGGNVDTLLHTLWGRYKFNYLQGNLDYFIGINQEILAEMAEQKVSPRKIKLIPNGVDTNFYKPVDRGEKERLKSSLNLGKDLVVLYSGRLHKVKNLQVLIESFSRLGPFLSTAKLVMVGSGPEEGNLKKQVQEKGLSGKVLFVPAQSEVINYLQAADIFTLPSQREGMANALLEAMACGLAPVASNVGGNRDLITSGENGLLVEPGDAGALVAGLLKLVGEAKLREQFGRRAREKVARDYGLAATIEAYREIYRTMAGKNYKNPFPILAYHRIQEKPEYGMDVSTACFARQMEWIHQQGWHTVSLDKIKECLENDLAFPAKSFVLTFDDGHKDNYTQAFPILKKYGFSALVYVTGNYIGTTRYTVKTAAGRQWLEEKPADWQDRDKVNFRKFEFLDWPEIKEMRAGGLEFGAHTLTHPSLTSLIEQEQLEEIQKSKKLLEDRLGVLVEHFCYPYQDFNPRTKQLVKQAGFRTAAYAPSHYDLTFFWDDEYALERIAVFGEFNLKKFEWLVTGRYFKLRRFLSGVIWDRLTALRRLTS